MRSIFLALSLLITLCASANAATVHHAYRRHAIVHPNQAYAPPGPPIRYYPAPYGDPQGYAPGEREQFLDSVRQGG
jgi:hypothetical protein